MENPLSEGDAAPVTKLIADAARIEHTNSGVGTALFALRTALSDYHRYKQASKKSECWRKVVDEMYRLEIHLNMSQEWKKIQGT
jgi:hypothetical protein